jgi:hypothetical protein
MGACFSVFTIYCKALNFESMYNFNSFIPSTYEFLTFYFFSLNYSRTQVNISFVISLHVIDRVLTKASLIASSPYLAAPPFPLPLSASLTPSFIPYLFINLSTPFVSGCYLQKKNYQATPSWLSGQKPCQDVSQGLTLETIKAIKIRYSHETAALRFTYFFRDRKLLRKARVINIRVGLSTLSVPG